MGLDQQIATKTAQRDQIKAQRQTAEQNLAAHQGQTLTVTATLVAGQVTATGNFAALVGQPDGWVTSPNTHVFPGTTVTDWFAATLTLSQPAKASGTVTLTVQTGSLALADAKVAELYAQTLALQAELEDISDGNAILDAITDGRAALVAAGHYLAPRSITRGAVGANPATLTNETTALQTFLQTTVGNGTSGTPKWAHLWRNVTYRADGQLTVTSKSWWRVDGHGSLVKAGAVGSATRVQLSLSGCSNFRVQRVGLRGSLPAGARVQPDLLGRPARHPSSRRQQRRHRPPGRLRRLRLRRPLRVAVGGEARRDGGAGLGPGGPVREPRTRGLRLRRVRVEAGRCRGDRPRHDRGVAGLRRGLRRRVVARRRA